jgi:D-3-phosphoglycerate dehydrogenase
MAKLQIGLPSALRRKDGSPAFPGYDLTSLADEGLAELSYFDSKPALEPNDLRGYDIAVLLGERITAQSIPDDGRLVHFARMGVGFDTLDLAACTAQDVLITNTPPGVRRPMAVAVMTYMLALTTNIFAKNKIAREGPAGWAKTTNHHGMGLIGRTLGIVGLGNIGSEVARITKTLGMRTIACDPYIEASHAEELEVELVSLEQLFRQADVISINCPLTDETRHLVNEERLALMKPTAYLINTARGPVVDQKAITEVLREKRIAGAALDVQDPEPSAADEPLNELDNVILAPHALGLTDQMWMTMAEVHITAFRGMLEGQVPEFVVNEEVLERAGFQAKLARLAGDS